MNSPTKTTLAAARLALLLAVVLTLSACVTRGRWSDGPGATAEAPPAAMGVYATDGPGTTAAAMGVAVTPNIYSRPSNRRPASVLRTGRYQLLLLTPTAGERKLLKQVVTIDLPPSMLMTVRDGIEHVLRDSGLHLCPPNSQAGFLSTPLPAVHRELGPTTLRAALQVLAGPAWRLHVDYARRTVCFSRRAVSGPGVQIMGS